jgi:hypothetical protein
LTARWGIWYLGPKASNWLGEKCGAAIAQGKQIARWVADVGWQQHAHVGPMEVKQTMKRWMGWLAVVSLLAGGSLLCLGGLFGYYPQPIRDRLDRRALRRHFDLPSGLRLIGYDGYPPMVGLGQREGLHIRSVYQVREKQEEAFIGRLVESGWSPLPIPGEIREKIRPYVAPDLLALSSGLYLCRTAGNDVLRARETRPCAEVAWPNDAIVGVYDRDTHRLYLHVGSGY